MCGLHLDYYWSLKRWKPAAHHSDSNELFDGAIKVALWWFLSSFLSAFFDWKKRVLNATKSWENKFQFDIVWSFLYLMFEREIEKSCWNGKEAPLAFNFVCSSTAIWIDRIQNFWFYLHTEWYFNLSNESHLLMMIFNVFFEGKKSIKSVKLKVNLFHNFLFH
jgi:hypothetical protein